MPEGPKTVITHCPVPTLREIVQRYSLNVTVKRLPWGGAEVKGNEEDVDCLIGEAYYFQLACRSSCSCS